MRSRYSAYALNELDYVKATWHPEFRPPRLDPDSSLRWIGLEVIAAPTPMNETATVEFEARLLHLGRVDGVHEQSQFVYSNGRSLYTQGEQLPLRFAPWKPGRNESCPCGSGKKFKRCCGA